MLFQVFLGVNVFQSSLSISTPPIVATDHCPNDLHTFDHRASNLRAFDLRSSDLRYQSPHHRSSYASRSFLASMFFDRRYRSLRLRSSLPIIAPLISAYRPSLISAPLIVATYHRAPPGLSCRQCFPIVAIELYASDRCYRSLHHRSLRVRSPRSLSLCHRSPRTANFLSPHTADS